MPPTRTPTVTPSGGGGTTGGDGTGNVTTLPSTGQGQMDGNTWNLALLSLLALGFLIAAAFLAHHTRKR
jgi:hypothetical protein